MATLINIHAAAGQARGPMRARAHTDRLPCFHVCHVHQKRHRCLQVRDGQGRGRVGKNARARQARGVLRAGRPGAVYADEARAALRAPGSALGQRTNRAPAARHTPRGVDADFSAARARWARGCAVGIVGVLHAVSMQTSAQRAHAGPVAALLA